ncbi:Carcinoembryonic antigen-related cell adhesion molecule 21 [Myotis davidii]|uniref:Carcinoembryonic antigen-related cell adhesion molecule 21 n=1 Tax=Myotis davidii TaxID=225400 RepID=L5LG31_MYODS|nr:Carcinoembryonic antigen-related cell adhesion molecule 21 [Myotis davidii]
MDSLSAPIRRGPVPWQGLLLAVSLLNFWSLPTTAQLAIVSTNAEEGQDVILRIRNKPPNVRGFMWYRGEWAYYEHNIAGLGMLAGHRPGPAHSGREQINFDGSLLIKRVTLEDTGNYTLVVYLGGSKADIGFGQLNVYERVRVPTLLVSKTTVTENKDSVVLICYTNAVSIQWFFNGINLWMTRRKKLSWNDRTLTIDPVWKEDAGNYHCKVSNPISSAESEPVGLEIRDTHLLWLTLQVELFQILGPGEGQQQRMDRDTSDLDATPQCNDGDAQAILGISPPVWHTLLQASEETSPDPVLETFGTESSS